MVPIHVLPRGTAAAICLSSRYRRGSLRYDRFLLFCAAMRPCRLHAYPAVFSNWMRLQQSLRLPAQGWRGTKIGQGLRIAIPCPGRFAAAYHSPQKLLRFYHIPIEIRCQTSLFKSTIYVLSRFCTIKNRRHDLDSVCVVFLYAFFLPLCKNRISSAM